jgi:hypothetical protein
VRSCGAHSAGMDSPSSSGGRLLDSVRVDANDGTAKAYGNANQLTDFCDKTG